MDLDGLIARASRHVSIAGSDSGNTVQLLPGLGVLRQHATSSFESLLYEPVVCLILQGRKQVTVGEHTLSFGPGECLLVTHDVPVRSRITKAPYLALVLEVNVATIRKLYDEVPGLVLENEQARAADTQRADPGLLDALNRYLALADTPADAKVLGRLISKEIHYRLLTAPFGGMLRQLIRHDSHASAIARAISHIRSDLGVPLALPDLARRVGMSVSSLHKHFRAITSTTPLQYQKELRLTEARRLLATNGVAVSAAAYAVGYESPSQFSREYARRFGAPPSQHAARRRDASVIG